tara:strand:+ start:2654 stop:4303 length:1650 start_codon:yes stop_codon:yes gene_type:complete
MEKLFESFRNFATLTEDQLLIEGRKEDAAKKYPELAKKREELEGESLLDVLMDKDPSGNQKYLMRAAYLLDRSMKNAEEKNNYTPFYGKQWPEDADDNLYSPWGVASNIGNELVKYHKLMPYIRGSQETYKDVNQIDSYAQLQIVVQRALGAKEDRERKKKEKAQQKKIAQEGSEVIADTPYHLVVRPLTKEASCYFGQQTKWCISATRSQNYFDQYTSDGKAFLFLLAKRKDIDPAYAKIAVVLDQSGEFEEYFNAEDDNLYLRQFRDGMLQTMVGTEASDEIVSMEEDEPFEEGPIMKAAEELDLMSYIDEGDEIETVVQVIKETVDEYIDDLERKGRQSVEDTPAGTPEEDYEELLSTYSANWNHIDVQLMFPSDTGSDQVYWESGLYVDVEEYVLNRFAEQGYQFVPGVMEGEMEEELRTSVDNALNNINIWPEEINQETWGDSPGTEFRIRVHDGLGSLERFEQFLKEQSDNDRNFDEDFAEYLRDHLEDEGVIVDPEKLAAEKELERQKTRDAEYWPDPEEKKKQLELPLQENRIRLKIVKNK